MKILMPIAVLAAVALAACNNGGSDSQKGNQPATPSTETDKNPTPQTGTGGEQQGTQPSQPANPPQ
ncbi:hypothetical protein [Mesorhizobium retamae]|uniref:Lipoprotein n=1 Tax=Mesorhizobium retamae TaxID=2912854 RepID=A0ABS9QLD9_9HYPH|nr:hypothetical protein [Mesorhizobium sp. IRAMC:0171]MCG7508241.1 hypothetical protein [Mesorhizobium sp. IRAMC:0171]